MPFERDLRATLIESFVKRCLSPLQVSSAKAGFGDCRVHPGRASQDHVAMPSLFALGVVVHCSSSLNCPPVSSLLPKPHLSFAICPPPDRPSLQEANLSE